MNTKRAIYLSENMDRLARRDRIFLNNPVIMQGLGLAPLVVVATTGRNALMLCAAVAMMLLPTRVVAAALSRLGYYRFRALAYCFTSSVVYIGVYFAMRALFGVEMLQLGIYLPLLVVEPLIIKRYERPQSEKLSAAFHKGLYITGGYLLVVMIVGCLREILGVGTLFGQPLTWLERIPLPLMNLPAGGFILLGVLCAVWRGAVNRYKKHVNMEAKRGL